MEQLQSTTQTIKWTSNYDSLQKTYFANATKSQGAPTLTIDNQKIDFENKNNQKKAIFYPTGISNTLKNAPNEPKS